MEDGVDDRRGDDGHVAMQCRRELWMAGVSAGLHVVVAGEECMARAGPQTW